jgi:hypothetical protein
VDRLLRTQYRLYHRHRMWVCALLGRLFFVPITTSMPLCREPVAELLTYDPPPMVMASNSLPPWGDGDGGSLWWRRTQVVDFHVDSQPSPKIDTGVVDFRRKLLASERRAQKQAQKSRASARPRRRQKQYQNTHGRVLVRE